MADYRPTAAARVGPNATGVNDTDAADWSDLCHEYDRMLTRMERANKQLFAWLCFIFLQAVIGWGCLLWALTR